MFDEYMDRLNKSALLVVNERYLEQLAPWVKDSEARLSYVQKDIERIIADVVSETGAEHDYLHARFTARLKERLAEEAVVIKNVKGDEGLEDVHKDDIISEGEVEGAGLEEALKVDKKVDLKSAATWPTCFRCSSTLNPVWAAVSPVCKTCTNEMKQSGWTVEAIGEGKDWDSNDEETEPDKPSLPEDSELFQCKLCNEKGKLVKGTHEELVAHVSERHQDVLDKGEAEEEQANDDDNYTAKVADVPRGTEDTAVVPPANDDAGDRFDDIVQDLADRAAAQQFSQSTDEIINQIASQYQVDPQQVKQALYATATFGKYTGVNGAIDTDGNTVTPDAYTEVQMPESQSGRVGAHEAVVPTQIVVNHVAKETGMTPELVYSMVKDKYGADLPDKYHASVTGEHHYYLPTSLVGEQAPPDQNPPTPPAAPAPDPSQQQPGM